MNSRKGVVPQLGSWVDLTLHRKKRLGSYCRMLDRHRNVMDPLERRFEHDNDLSHINSESFLNQLN
jgi:hypothetical protein